ncbi:MAG: HD domain-containing phosphohydrolase [Bacillota bacterium]
MSKLSLEEMSLNQIKRLFLIVLVILLLFVTLISIISYRHIYTSEQKRVEATLKSLFRDVDTFFQRVEIHYGDQLRSSLHQFYRNYNSDDTPTELRTKIKEVKSDFEVAKDDIYQIKEINYYLIDSSGTVITTDYQPDQSLNLFEIPGLKSKLINLEPGEVFLQPVNQERQSEQLRLYGYIKLPDGRLFELGISFNHLKEGLSELVSNIRAEEHLDLALFTYRFNKLFDTGLEVKQPDMNFLQQAKDEGGLVKKEESFLKEVYYKSWSSNYGQLYAIISVEHHAFAIILKLIYTLLIFLFIAWIIFNQIIREKVKEIIEPIGVIANDMEQFHQTYEPNLDLDETGILEIDNIIDNYKEMANEISVGYQQLEAYSEELEDKNKELEEKQTKLRKIINLAPDHIFMKDQDGNFELVNSTHANFYNLSISEMEGKNEREIHHIPEETEKYLAADQEMINEGKMQETEDITTAPNGEQHILKMVKIPFEKDDETHILAVGQDITEEKEIQQRLKEQKEELEANNQQLKAYNEQVTKLNQNLEDSYQAQEELVNKLELVINLISQLPQGSIGDEEAFLSKLLYSAFTVIDEADYGSVYLFGDQEVEFVDSIGFDLEALQELSIPKTAFEIPEDKIVTIDNRERTASLMSEELREKFLAATKPVKETIAFDLMINDQKQAGFSLDIAQDSQVEFDEHTYELIEAFKSLALAFYEIQRYQTIQYEFQKEIVDSMINMLEVHDEYTKGHSENVAKLSVKIAYELGVSLEKINDVYWAGMLHDIGKTVIPQEILNKIGKLTDAEYEEIKQHPVYGYEALSDSKLLQRMARYIYYHHERCDGEGYPKGLVDEEIPLVSKILTVADAWDAMRSDRSYRDALPKEVAIKEIKKNKGEQFDAEVVEAFLQVIEDES